MFLKKIKEFSFENWWIYIFLVLTLVIIYFTGKGSLLEISIIFLLNFLGNLFIMIMQDYYTSGIFKKGAVFHLSSVIIFTSISIYGLLAHNQAQYIIWQFMYMGAAIKAFLFYVLGKDIKLFNQYTFLFLNIILFYYFQLKISQEVFPLLQAVGFSLITSGLVSINDKTRYWLNIIGITFLQIGSLGIVISSFNNGSLDSIGFGYLLLTSATYIFYLKLLPKYLTKKG